MNKRRRRLLLWMLAGSVMGPSMVPTWLRDSLAMGKKDYPQGMQTIEGDVQVNGTRAEVGTLVNVGDVVTTGEDGYAVFVMQRSAYMVRENSRVELTAAVDDENTGKMVLILTMLHGSLLSVFGKGKRRIETSTAVIGIRGTALYVESEAARSYVCTCYGTVEIRSRFNRNVRERVKTRYHDKPRWVYGKGVDVMLVEAPVINHTDDELILLESLVGRRPPFINIFGGRVGSSTY
ncbi:MAG: FecR domain-containing protein [Deltaproteobacteria bacterium]|nr:FecR domain-containing protein [Deltaproteobacteria bacterium]MBW2611890.1 FecR domain-containing protein [Deltaproteobacteria bacterium]